MRIGILALLHESNTFSAQPTTLSSFRHNLLVSGEKLRVAMADAHHEVGGFFAGLEAAGGTAVPLFAARALPSGTIAAGAFEELLERLLGSVEENLPLDGLLVAPHGATVSERVADADGYWLQRVRDLVGPELPIVGTLDAHANLSPRMVENCNALIAYRTNPHLDQRERGIAAAEMIVRAVRGEIDPIMSASYPPLAINIERQCTEELPLRELYDAANVQLLRRGILSNSITLGFPYADVEEMGAATIAITDGDKQLADELAGELAMKMWEMRSRFCPTFVSVDDALDRCAAIDSRVCLLDMGDNVGGGSAGDGTELLSAIQRRGSLSAFGCLYDPESVQLCQQAGVGTRLQISAGGKTDHLHGEPIEVTARVRSLHDGRFRELVPRHGGISEFDQGPTAVCETERGLTLMLTSKRMVPFSLQQLYSCDVDPKAFRILVAKGVNAPLAAYREVCREYIRVDTIGSTSADLSRFTYRHRRRPMYPFELDAEFIRASKPHVR